MMKEEDTMDTHCQRHISHMSDYEIEHKLLDSIVDMLTDDVDEKFMQFIEELINEVTERRKSHMNPVNVKIK